MENHLDFHFADTDILQSGRVDDGLLHIADLAIKLVIVPPMRVIEPPLAEWLAAFEAAGGWVIRCAQGFAADDMLASIREHVAPSLSVQVGGQGGGSGAGRQARRRRTDALVCAERRQRRR